MLCAAWLVASSATLALSGIAVEQLDRALASTPDLVEFWIWPGEEQRTEGVPVSTHWLAVETLSRGVELCHLAPAIQCFALAELPDSRRPPAGASFHSPPDWMAAWGASDNGTHGRPVVWRAAPMSGLDGVCRIDVSGERGARAAFDDGARWRLTNGPVVPHADRIEADSRLRVDPVVGRPAMLLVVYGVAAGSGGGLGEYRLWIFDLEDMEPLVEWPIGAVEYSVHKAPTGAPTGGVDQRSVRLKPFVRNNHLVLEAVVDQRCRPEPCVAPSRLSYREESSILSRAGVYRWDAVRGELVAVRP